MKGGYQKFLHNFYHLKKKVKILNFKQQACTIM